MSQFGPTDFQNYKLFKDTVHGYIRIPVPYCRVLIDTPEFQRLRRIEQTSMRPLYPCARHDRFSHSLGTYHLGSLALENIKRNAFPKDTINETEWETLSCTFRIACLLHDIGHAPFSHTFEDYFDKKHIDKQLTKEGSMFSKDFRRDYKEIVEKSKNHEKLSALIVLHTFSKAIKEDLHAEPLLAARMIIGCQFSDKNKLSNYESVANCLVTLLNGDGIDVDRLDYTSRDLWASGVETSTIDLQRLLSSLCIRKHNNTYKLAFLKNAISVIESVLDVRNFLHSWIFSHHKVVYDQYLLKNAIETLAINLTGKKRKDALSTLFSVKSFFSSEKVGNYHIKLITDDDLIFLMKQDIEKNKTTSSDNAMHSWLYRQHKLVPLWKTYPEFRAIFKDIPDTKLNNLHRNVKKLAELSIKPSVKNFHIEHISQSYHKISDKEIIVDIGGKIITFKKLRLPQRCIDDPCPFFYIYVDNDLTEKERNKMIDELIRLAKK